ncbi:hypothetical protein CY34DRAFT_11258 [Suillus luteus UH-Slu-Lm8-n1]|uniref:WD40 repeat-like protein n=1 Tax=Suillus luteus UH-Slu-Lm8-n1 TaxID=930992 RepID=A0A0D0B2C7_9AGAM|nr:hypothetical protein CY34DRAFT_11258 [Suillus luteus UH-Slu-Lm8-n1]
METIALSPDGKKMVSGSFDHSLKLWNVDTGKVIKIWTGHIKWVRSMSWSPDGGRVVSGSEDGTFREWDVESGKTILGPIKAGEDIDDVGAVCYSPDPKMIATAGTSFKTAQLWDLETNQPIRAPFLHQEYVNSATFSADGKSLVTSCIDNHIYTWDVSAIVKKAGIPSGILQKRQVPVEYLQGFLTMYCERLIPFTSVWRRYKPHGAAEPATQSRSKPFSWTQNLSGILRRRDRSDIQLREVEVPYTAGKSRNYHARKKKPAASSSRPTNTRTTHQPSAAAQGTPSSSRLPPPTNTTSIPSAIPGTIVATGTVSRLHITVAGWRACFVAWICCMPIQNADGHH